MRGFGRFTSAARFCAGCAEQRQDCRAATRCGAHISRADRRGLFQDRRAAMTAAQATA